MPNRQAARLRFSPPLVSPSPVPKVTVPGLDASLVPPARSESPVEPVGWRSGDWNTEAQRYRATEGGTAAHQLHPRSPLCLCASVVQTLPLILSATSAPLRASAFSPARSPGPPPAAGAAASPGAVARGRVQSGCMSTPEQPEAAQTRAPSPDAPVLIGWRERVDIPEWKLRGVKAKIDTGARTSAIDVAQYELLDDDHVRFEVVSRIRPERKTRWVTARLSRTTRVRPSSGDLQERIVCTVPVRIGPYERTIDVSLVCRRRMLCRMLIGRSALAGCFVVDPASKYLIKREASGP